MGLLAKFKRKVRRNLYMHKANTHRVRSIWYIRRSRKQNHRVFSSTFIASGDIEGL